MEAELELKKPAALCQEPPEMFSSPQTDLPESEKGVLKKGLFACLPPCLHTAQPMIMQTRA